MSVSTDRVRELIALATMDGRTLRLEGQLDRKEYVAVDKVLTAAGGKWDRKARAHVFPGSPMDALGEYLGGGSAPKPTRTTEGYVATPDHIADLIVGYADRLADLTVAHAALEPSAGDGRLAAAILRENPDLPVVAVEPNAERAKQIADPRVEVLVDSIESYAATGPQPFDRVIMNPPFAVPGGPTVWIDHVQLAWTLLRPGGRLVSVAPAGLVQRQDRRHAAMRALVGEHGGWDYLPDDAFKASGTAVHTVVLWLDRPGVLG